MIKKTLFMPLPLIGAAMLVLPLWAQADSFGGNQNGGTLTSAITLTVGTPTCTMDVTGLHIRFDAVTETDLRNESRDNFTDFDLICETPPNSLTLTITPVSGVVNSTLPGVIESDVDNAGFKLVWGNNSAFGEPGVPFIYNTPLIAKPATVNKIAFIVTPVALSPAPLTAGKASVNLKLTLNYS